MPWTSALAQFPTPTTATRTLSLERACERFDDDGVGARRTLVGVRADPVAKRRRKPEHDGRALSGLGATASAWPEGDVEAVGEHLDRDVVERRLAARHLACEPALQPRRHPHQHACHVAFRHLLAPYRC